MQMEMDPVLSIALAGKTRAERVIFFDQLQEKLDQWKALSLAVDGGDLYLPGLEPSVAKYPQGEWGRN